MKKHVMDFFHRGFLAAGFGPIVVAIIYLCVQGKGEPLMFSVNEVALAILTSALLAFVAAGVNVVYQIEKLPLMWAIFIHVIVLYFDYLLIYLVNGWMKSDWKIILVFTICFVGGYIIIWSLIYFLTIRPSINKLNRKLQEEV